MDLMVSAEQATFLEEPWAIHVKLIKFLYTSRIFGKYKIGYAGDTDVPFV